MKTEILQNSKTRHTNRFLVVKAMKLRISMRGSFKMKWDIFIIILALYNCTLTPFFISFAPDLNSHIIVRGISILIDLVFLIDLFFLFFTTFFNDQGEEIENSKAIIMHTLQNSFTISFMSSIPIEILIILIPNAKSVLILLIIFKTLRFARLGRVFMVLRMRLVVKLSALIAQLLVLLFVYINIIACSWYYLVKINKTWRPTVAVDDIYDSPLLDQYIIMYYSACYTLLGIELYPTSFYEYLFLNVTLLMGALVNLVLVGEIVGIMSMVNRETRIYNDLRDKVVDYMIKVKVDQVLQLKILNLVNLSYKYEDDQAKYKQLVKMIPPSLKKQVYHKIYRRIFVSNTMFMRNPDLEKFACLAFKQLFFKPEVTVFRQFDTAKNMYFVSSGKFRAFVDNVYVKRIRTGQYFGEIGLIFGCPRTATVLSKNFSTVGSLSLKHFRVFTKKFPEIYSLMLKEINEYSDKTSMFLKSTLSKIEYFGKLKEEELNIIRFSLRKECYRKGDFLFRANSGCKKAFAIISGMVNLQFKVKRLGDVYSDIVIEELKKGSTLNAMHVLIDYKHAVSCEVVEDVIVYEYTFDELKELYGRIPSLKILVGISNKKLLHQGKKGTEKRALSLDYYDRKIDFYFKNQVIRTILLRRKFRDFVGIKMLTKKVRAFLLAKNFGLKKFAEEIAVGKFSPHLAEGGSFLTKSDMENPLCPHFAYEVSRTNMSYQLILRQFLHLHQICLKNNLFIEDLRARVSVYSRIVDQLS